MECQNVSCISKRGIVAILKEKIEEKDATIAALRTQVEAMKNETVGHAIIDLVKARDDFTTARELACNTWRALDKIEGPFFVSQELRDAIIAGCKDQRPWDAERGKEE